MKIISPHFPQPFDVIEPVNEFYRNSDVDVAIEILKLGKSVVVADLYSTGLKLLNALRQTLKKTQPLVDFEEQRQFRALYRRFSNRILLEIVD